jgi:hypothetical protein
MRTLFNQTDNEELLQRIDHLTVNSKAIWGKMNVAQMMAHCQQPIRVAFGLSESGRTLIGRLFGNIVKKQLLSDRPWRKSLPTDKTFVIADSRDFEKEKENLKKLVRKFSTDGPGALSKRPHPFFGKMSEEEWGRMSWKHLDHHLQQFGV